MRESVAAIATFLLWSMGLRFFIFQYKGMRWFQNWLKRAPQELVRELAECAYCQNVESALLLCLILRLAGLSHMQPTEIALWALSAGWVGLITEYWLQRSIELLESSHANDREGDDEH